jgi:hypothetical protein
MARGFEVTTGLVIQQGLFEENIAAQHKIGTRLQLADGRVFYYAKAGGTLYAGKLCESVSTITGHEDVDTSAQSVGDYEVTVTLNTTSISEANEYAEGFIGTRETGGVGQMLKIKSHGTQTATTGTLALTLYDPITTALLATGQADMMKSPFKDVIVSATQGTNPCGIPLIPVTDEYYFWCQTWGTACCLVDTAAALGDNLVAATDDGAVQQIATNTAAVALIDYPLVGVNIGAVGANVKYTHILLRLYP